MKKRIGTKLYDTEKSELVCPIEGGQLYRKRTRNREWFAVMDDGTVKTMDMYNPFDVLLMETGKSFIPDEEPPASTMIRVDRETHDILAAEADRIGCPISELVRDNAKAYKE